MQQLDWLGIKWDSDDGSRQRLLNPPSRLDGIIFLHLIKALAGATPSPPQGFCYSERLLCHPVGPPAFWPHDLSLPEGPNIVAEGDMCVQATRMTSSTCSIPAKGAASPMSCILPALVTGYRASRLSSLTCNVAFSQLTPDHSS